MAISRRRLAVLIVFLSLWAGIVLARLGYVQLVRHDDYVARALDQQESTLLLTPVRGSITDSQGRILAESIVAESVCANPGDVANVEHAAQSLAAITELGVSKAEIVRRLKGSARFAWIARQISPSAAASVRRLKINGIYLIEEHKRSYPKTTLAANMMGYVGLDGEGLAGIEQSLNTYVRGRAGKVTVLRDARKGLYLVGGEGANAPVDGHDVVLTMDEVIQFITERALLKAATQYKAAGATAVVLDPASGAILAMASYPTFDPASYKKFTPSEWRNRAVQDIYEPGSTFKMVTAAAGLEENLVTPSQMIDCELGSIQIGGARIREHGGHKYGLISFEDVLVHSSNVGTIKVGLGLGRERLHDYVRRFGFGAPSGVELPGEAKGLVRPIRRWSQLSNATVSIGQEIGVTPLQIARATAAIANGGLLVQPRILERIVDADGRTVATPAVKPPVRVISEKNAALLNEMLKSVVSRGTGRNAAMADHVVAGKTGTAQKAGRGGYTNQVVASFAGYVPADRPKLVILVAVDEPKGAQYGGTIAAPVFKEIAEASLRYLEVPPSIPQRELEIATVPPTPPVRRRAIAPKLVRRGSVTGAEVPSFAGLDGRAAIAAATLAGYVVETTGSGFVQAQNPLPGTRASVDQPIQLTLAPMGQGIR